MHNFADNMCECVVTSLSPGTTASSVVALRNLSPTLSSPKSLIKILIKPGDDGRSEMDNLRLRGNMTERFCLNLGNSRLQFDPF